VIIIFVVAAHDNNNNNDRVTTMAKKCGAAIRQKTAGIKFDYISKLYYYYSILSALP
jgi:hypothetical protein